MTELSHLAVGMALLVVGVFLFVDGMFIHAISYDYSVLGPALGWIDTYINHAFIGIVLVALSYAELKELV